MPIQIHRPLQIILGVDGSENSLAAAHMLKDLPLPGGSTITALGVLTLAHTVSRSKLLAALDQAKEQLKSNEVRVDTGILHGHPAAAIVQYAEEHTPDLIIVGATGLHATLGILLGGVVQQLVEYSHWPVLVVRLPYEKIQRVLIVTDGSPSSDNALECVAGQDCPSFPFPSDIELRVLHVIPVIRPEEAAVNPSLKDEEENTGKEVLDKAVKILKQSRRNADTILLHGDPATEITRYAKENEIDLIVAGSHGLSAVRSWMLGDVVRKLVHFSHCSVLVYRSPGEK
jgi:nucleotide-binding universal stress UspA family protein